MTWIWLTANAWCCVELRVHRGEQLVAEVADGAALRAHEVVVGGLGRDLVVADAALEARLDDEVEAHEQLERAVHRRDVDVGERAAHLGRHLLGRHVAAGVAQHLPDEVALRRQPVALFAECGAGVMHGAPR